jgi:hypothetical protein
MPDANAVYLRNMAQLWRRDPALAARVDAVADEHRVPVEGAKSGAWTATMVDATGQKAYLHSRYDPVAEAAKLVDGVDTTDQYCFIVGGFGLGYHLLELRKRASAEALIVVAEPCVPLIAAALSHVDFSEMLAQGSLIILTSADKSQLHERLRHHSALVMLGAKFVTHPPSQRLAGEFHAHMRALVTDFIAYSRMTLMTLVSNSRITCHNVAYNIAGYVTTPPIDILKDRFSGWPAIVVSAGPSLRKNIDQLAEAKGRAIICAVQTTLKPLVQRGIKPDFVTSLDFHEISRQYFEGVEGLEDVHLVAEPKATWHVIDHFPGPVSLLDNEFARRLIGDDLAPRESLPAGATVAHLAFYLARYMGCDPIIFVGQDLAFTGHVFYVPGVETHRTWRSEINRFNTMETKEWERIVRNRPVLRKTIGINGEEIYSDELLFTYLEQLEKDVAETGARVINATEGGARIRGMNAMTLAQALETYCGKRIPPERFSYRRETRWRDPSKLEAARREISDRIEEVGKMESVCVEMLELLKKLEGLTHDPDKFNRTLVRVDELRAQVSQSNRAFRIVNSASQLAELRRFSADRRINASKTDEVARAKTQLKRDSEFVASMRDASRDMRAILTGALERIEAADSRTSLSPTQ